MSSECAARLRAGIARWRGPPGRAVRNGKRAFTLIELLVVISIIALLVGILVPSIAMAKELARRAKCATNLHGIGRALLVYEAANGSYPYVSLNGAGWGVEIGTARDVDPSDGVANDRNPTSCLYLLVRESHCPPDMFICPSTEEEAGDATTKAWDFADGTGVSYSLMCPYGPVRQFDEGDRMRPIMADASPYFDPGTGLRNEVAVVNWADVGAGAGVAGNSPNHAGKGQNIATPGGSTSWRRRADVGVRHDNIYTRAADDADSDDADSDDADSDGTDSGGSIPDAGADGSAADQGPAGPLDSYLVP